MNDFRLGLLSFHGNIVFEKIDLELSDKSDSNLSSPYFTAVIGSNGTGKSNLLRFLIDVFRLVQEKQNNNPITFYPSGYYYLDYVLNGETFGITNRYTNKGDEVPYNEKDIQRNKRVSFWKNGSEIDSSEMQIPKSILALSIMLSDRFLFKNKTDNNIFPQYKYLGIRRDASTAGTQTFVNSILENIYLAFNKKYFISDIQEMLKFLELKNEFHISYYPKRMKYFFTGNLKVDEFENYFQDEKAYMKNRATVPWNIAVFKTLKDEQPEILNDLVDLLNFITKNIEHNDGKPYYEFDILNDDQIINKIPLFQQLHKLDLISFPSIVLGKEEYYEIHQGSSGEQHFITTFISLFANIEGQSLILIDEPEVSLHPNWQMKFFSFLNKLFENKYSSTHFIICTHSHFLLSDLRGENSKIIGLKREDGKIGRVDLPRDINTYGWSAEEVLYKVFKVTTTRNYYVAHEISSFLKDLSNKSNNYFKNGEEIGKRIELMKQLQLSLTDVDPLKAVINAILKKIDNVL